MKYLLLLFPIICMAELSIKDELKRRLALYGLTQLKSPIDNEFERDFNYNDLTIKELQKDILENYTRYLEDHLGRCHSNECLVKHKDYYKFKTESSNICLPYTKCGYYKCMEEKYQCTKANNFYFTKLARPTCNNYLKNIDKKLFSQKGYNWIYSVMVCLQKGLTTECEVKGSCNKETRKKTCSYITDFTLRFHPGCYINSGIGVCNLPIKDKINIWRTVAKYLTKDEFKQAVETVKHCIKLERGHKGPHFNGF